jgi:hypothetical protein
MNVIDGGGQSGSAEALTNYMTKEGHTLRGSHGRELTDDEVNRFHESTERHDFSRQFVMAPERDDYSDEELSRATRQSLNEWQEQEDMNSMEYCYAVHNDDDETAVHVAMTASKESGDIFIEDNDEIAALRDDIAAEFFQDFSDHNLDRDQQQDQQQEQDRETITVGDMTDDQDMSDHPLSGGLELAADAVETPEIDFGIDEEVEQEFEEHEQSRDRSRSR